jgi:hypothetical protein
VIHIEQNHRRNSGPCHGFSWRVVCCTILMEAILSKFTSSSCTTNCGM